eukprot:scaffold9810_cov72-Phaeocystis_antarctica.AAC.1
MKTCEAQENCLEVYLHVQPEAARAGEQPGGDRLLPEVRVRRGRGHEGLLQEDRAARRGRAVQKAQVTRAGRGLTLRA